MKNSLTHVIAFVLVIVGSLNWGLVGLFKSDLVKIIFGNIPWLMNLIYILVGVAGVVLLATHKKDCKVCSSELASRTSSSPGTAPRS